jgi:hypothetical protein
MQQDEIKADLRNRAVGEVRLDIRPDLVDTMSLIGSCGGGVVQGDSFIGIPVDHW